MDSWERLGNFVLLPYEITLFSNTDTGVADLMEFYYLMKLHYSQTSDLPANAISVFYYLMKLHYSQTVHKMKSNSLKFYYLMKLHYSQTKLEF